MLLLSQFIIASFTTGKKFGVTDFVNAANCGSKSVSQVVLIYYTFNSVEAMSIGFIFFFHFRCVLLLIIKFFFFFFWWLDLLAKMDLSDYGWSLSIWGIWCVVVSLYHMTCGIQLDTSGKSNFKLHATSLIMAASWSMKNAFSSLRFFTHLLYVWFSPVVKPHLGLTGPWPPAFLIFNF